MKLFKKKPLLVEAVQFVPENFKEFEKIFNIELSELMMQATLKIETTGDVIELSPDDWLLQDARGSLRSCPNDIFTALFESA